MKKNTYKNDVIKEKLDSSESVLASGAIRPLFFKLALPAVVAQIVNMLYNMVDRMYIGHMEDVGSIALTGVGVSAPLIIILSAFAVLIGGGGAPRASILLGAGKKKEAEDVINTAASSSLIIGLILTLILLLFLQPLLVMLGASLEALPYSMDYTRIYLMGTVAVMFSLGMNQFISVQGFAKDAMLTTVIGAILNIILDPIFIFTFNMGVAGAALASILSQLVSAVWVFHFLRSDKSRLKLSFSLPKPAVLASIAALGASPFIMNSTESLLQIAFNRSLFHYGGDLYVASMSINSMIMLMMILPLLGFSQGAVSIISYNYGAKNSARVREAVKTLLVTNFTYSFVFTGLIILFPGFFVTIFSKDSALLEATIPTLRIYLAGSFLTGIQISCQQSFIAFGQAKLSAFMALLRKVILLIPLIYILPNFINPEVFGVYLAEPISDTIAAIVTGLTFYKFIKAELENIDADRNFIENGQ